MNVRVGNQTDPPRTYCLEAGGSGPRHLLNETSFALLECELFKDWPNSEGGLEVAAFGVGTGAAFTVARQVRGLDGARSLMVPALLEISLHTCAKQGGKGLGLVGVMWLRYMLVALRALPQPISHAD